MHDENRLFGTQQCGIFYINNYDMIKRIPLFWLLLFLVIYSLAWHFSLLGFSPFPILESKQSVSRLLLLYPALYLVLSLPFLFFFLRHPTSLGLRIVIILFFTLGLLIRIADWNIIYYYGNHIDDLFLGECIFL